MSEKPYPTFPLKIYFNDRHTYYCHFIATSLIDESAEYSSWDDLFIMCLITSH